MAAAPRSVARTNQEIKEYYINWFQETLPKVEKLQTSEETVKKIIEIAKDFSLLISPPSKNHSLVYKAVVEANLLERVNKACIFFQEFRKKHPEVKGLQWFSFEPLTEEIKQQKLEAFPLVLRKQWFKLFETADKLQAYWNHLMTCLCSAASPGGIDDLADAIAADLKGKERAILIDFGAGGCLPALPIVSRLTHMKQIDLFLVDPIYLPREHRAYQVKRHSIAEQHGRPPLSDSDVALAILELLGNCAKHFPEGCTLRVRVLATVNQLREKVIHMDKNVPHVLFAVDPHPKAAEDFKIAVNLIKGRTPSHYCLNEIAGVNGELTREEALDTDRIFSRQITCNEDG